METQNSQPDLLEELLAKILQDPELRAEMEKIQPIDVEKN